jgi:predicted DCC family thiol-disulfide oxidoreductase YuxK
MEKPVLFFDGDCALCNQSVLFILKHERKASMNFASLQSDFADNLFRDTKLPDSLVYVENSEVFVKSAAVFKIIDHLKGWPTIFKVFSFLPKGLLDVIYDFVARYRKSIFGTSTHCGLTSSANKDRFADINT